MKSKELESLCSIPKIIKETLYGAWQTKLEDSLQGNPKSRTLLLYNIKIIIIIIIILNQGKLPMCDILNILNII